VTRNRIEEPQKKFRHLLTVVGFRAFEDFSNMCAYMETNFSGTQYGQALFQIVLKTILLHW
jgi:hypothetical protein